MGERKCGSAGERGGRGSGRDTHLVQQERDDRGRLRGDRGREVERAQEGWCAEERGEEREDGEDVQLRDGEELRRVHVVPVPELVRCEFSVSALSLCSGRQQERTEHGLDLLGLALLDERVEDDDVLALHRSQLGKTHSN